MACQIQSQFSFLAFAFALFVHCSLFAGVQAIEGGQNVTSAGQFPFFVVLNNPHLCGAVLLSTHPTSWVLTAAHCLAGATLPPARPNDYYITYGNNIRTQQKVAIVKDWFIHPNYTTGHNPAHYVSASGDSIASNGDMRYDLALLELVDPIDPSENVTSGPLWPGNGWSAGTPGTVIGVGYTEIDGAEASVLQSLHVNLTASNSTYPSLVQIVAQKSTGVCHGDSGGPLLVIVNSTTYVAGITSRIYEAYDPDASYPTCATQYHQNAPSQDIFVNPTVFVDWISQTTGLAVEQLTSPDIGAPGSQNLESNSLNLTADFGTSESANRLVSPLDPSTYDSTGYWISMLPVFSYVAACLAIIYLTL